MKTSLLSALAIAMTLTAAPLLASAAFDRSLGYGDRGPAVVELQRFLGGKALLASDRTTGYFGPLTLNAVEAFQVQEKITPTSGFFGPLTRGRVNGMMGAGDRVAQQPRQPRIPGEKKSLPQLQTMQPTQQVVVKFVEGMRIRMSGGTLTGMSSNQSVTFIDTLTASGVPANSIRRLHSRPEEELDAERETAQRLSGRQLADLNLYYLIELPDRVSAAHFANRLNALDFIEYAEPSPIPAPVAPGLKVP